MSKRTTFFRSCKHGIVRRLENAANLESAELEMTVNMLIQIDKLVQLLESPVFTCTCFCEAADMFLADCPKTCVCSFSSPRSTRNSTNVSTEY